MLPTVKPDSPDNATFFQGASNINIHGSFTATANIQHQPENIWNLFYKKVSLNAILNAGGRADPVRCYPGTREEVISKIEGWTGSGYRTDRRILWLSGPAGAGKSAIMQTVAENCIKSKTPMANFFFFRADATRNHSRSLVPTLLRQLFQLSPALKAQVFDIIAQDELIFETPLRHQFVTLLENTLASSMMTGGLAQTPILLLIDGLDECDSKSDLDIATKAEQCAVLDVIHALVTRQNSPFIAVVASRAESHIQMAFNRLGWANTSVYLDENYRPDDDIRLYITAELATIKQMHPLGQYLHSQWPSKDIIEAIVDKSSGQFIYAATVARYVANSTQSPAFSMDMVLSIRAVQKDSPFAEIDAIYLFILSRTRHWESASEIIAVDAINRAASDLHISLSSLGCVEYEAVTFFSDLTSIIKTTISEDRIKLEFYHASFGDFLFSPRRARQFYVDLESAADTFAPKLIPRMSDWLTFRLAVDVLRKVTYSGIHLADAFAHIPQRPDSIQQGEVEDSLLPKLKALYVPHNKSQYKQIFRILKDMDWICETASPSAPEWVPWSMPPLKEASALPTARRRTWLHKWYGRLLR